MPFDTDEEVEPDEVSGIDADESEARLTVVIDKDLILEAGDVPVREPEPEPKEEEDGTSG
jgi:hypothetical protein